MSANINPSFPKLLWQLIKPYWQFKNRQWMAWLILTLVIILTFADVYMQILFNRWYSSFYNSIQNVDKQAFIHSMIQFSYLAFIFIIMAVYRMYLSQMLTIKWRRWLTDFYLNRWASNQIHYRMQLTGNETDNPDQRISEDVGSFITSTLGLFLGLFSAITTLCFFSIVLWHLSGPLHFQIGQTHISIAGYLLWASLLYAVVGTYLTHKLGQRLVPLNFNQQRFEADFRFSLVRFREQGENIAFYKGEPEEKKLFSNRFAAIFDNFWQIMKCQKRLTWFTSFYSQIALIFPFLMAAPRVFTKEIQMGGVIQIIDAFGKVQDSFSYFISAYVSFADWKATANRLVGFTQRMKEIEEKTKETGFQPQHSSSPVIEAKNLNIQLPDGQPLLNDLNFCFQKGESWLITGPSGCGKTTLMRTLAGIWSFANGALVVPENTSVLFLPQKTYLPLGTLKRSLCYPLSPEDISDERVEAVLEFCQLRHLYGMLGSTLDQSRLLSVGEQQRIGFARAILVKPDFLFLDEATSALDEPSEGFLYQLLKTECPDSCIVSVGHRNTLKQWHSYEFSCVNAIPSARDMLKLPATCAHML